MSGSVFWALVAAAGVCLGVAHFCTVPPVLCGRVWDGIAGGLVAGNLALFSINCNAFLNDLKREVCGDDSDD